MSGSHLPANPPGLQFEADGLLRQPPVTCRTLGDFLGGWGSDLWYKRTGNLVHARRYVAVAGFLLAGASILPATLTTDPIMCVIYTCFAVFGLELTVGVAWALPLDIGGDFAGSVSAV
ncbi:MAG: hypothetical protein WKF37_24745, partial [Bryobacteraceae bacterium]